MNAEQAFFLSATENCIKDSMRNVLNSKNINGFVLNYNNQYTNS